jgi:hypothetical protein
LEPVKSGSAITVLDAVEVVAEVKVVVVDLLKILAELTSVPSLER